MSEFNEIWNEEGELINRALGNYLEAKITEAKKLSSSLAQYFKIVRD